MANVTVYVVTSWSNLPSQSSPLEATALNHIETGIKNVTDFVNLLNTNNNSYYVLSQTAFTNALKSKLDGIEDKANNYTLPVATINTLGGVKVDGTTITISNGVISSTTSGIDELANLKDVDLDDLTNGQILKWDSTEEKWVNSSEAEVRTQLSLLEDVDIDDTSLEDGQVLKYNGTSEKWENGTGGGDVLDYDETIDVLGLPPNPIYRYKPLIPVMTSNTTPSGVASASSVASSTYDAYKAFIGRDTGETDRWATAPAAENAYLQYKFDSSITVSRFELKSRPASRKTGDTAVDCQITLQGSNDGTTFTNIKSLNLLASEADNLTSSDLTEPVTYMYYRLQFTGYNILSGGQHYCGLALVQLYEKYLA